MTWKRRQKRKKKIENYYTTEIPKTQLERPQTTPSNERSHPKSPACWRPRKGAEKNANGLPARRSRKSINNARLHAHHMHRRASNSLLLILILIILCIPMLGLTQLSNYLTLKGSFSAVSKPNFASRYALESSRRDLQNALLCTVLESNLKNQG